MREHRIVAGLLVGLLLVGCTASDTDDEDDAEVRGLVLEREDSSRPGPDPRDRARAEEREVPEDDAEPEGPDEADDSAGSDGSDGSTATVPDTGSPPSSGAEEEAPAPPATSSDGDDERATGPPGSTGSPSSEPPSSEPPSSEPSAPDRREPPREPTPAPEPPPPADLADGFTRGGMAWGVQDGEWVEVSSQVRERGMPLVAAGLQPVDDPDPAAAQRRARCAVALHAPEERGLRALGELEVRLVADDVDGTRRTLHRYLLTLDVELGADEVLEVPPPERHRTVQRDEVRRVSCEVRYDRA